MGIRFSAAKMCNYFSGKPQNAVILFNLLAFFYFIWINKFFSLNLSIFYCMDWFMLLNLNEIFPIYSRNTGLWIVNVHNFM